MFCGYCGAKLEENSLNCEQCGAEVSHEDRAASGIKQVSVQHQGLADERDLMDRSAAVRYFIDYTGIIRFWVVCGLVLLLLGWIFLMLGVLIMMLIFIAMAIGCFVLVKKNFYSEEATDEKRVDEIVAIEKEYLLKRGMEKLSLVKEQVQLIEPIEIIGTSYQPNLGMHEKKVFLVLAVQSYQLTHLLLLNVSGQMISGVFR